MERTFFMIHYSSTIFKKKLFLLFKLELAYFASHSVFKLKPFSNLNGQLFGYLSTAKVKISQVNKFFGLFLPRMPN